MEKSAFRKAASRPPGGWMLHNETCLHQWERSLGLRRKLEERLPLSCFSRCPGSIHAPLTQSSARQAVTAGGWLFPTPQPPPRLDRLHAGNGVCFGGCGPEVASTGATPSHSSFFGFKPAFFQRPAEVVGSYCCSSGAAPWGFLRLCSPGWLSTIPAGAGGFLGSGAAWSQSGPGLPGHVFLSGPRAV